MLSVLCLSPAIDTTISLPKFPRPGDVIKGANETAHVGGKGLNVARWLALRGERVRLAGLLGADNAAPFEEELSQAGIEDALTRVPGAARINIMFTSPCGMFKMNRPAFPGLDASAFPAEHFAEKLLGRTASAPDAFLLSGSLPATFPANFYAQLIALLKQLGPIVLDTAGKALHHGAEACPALIKPNRAECAELLGFSLQTEADFLRAISRLLMRTPLVILSDGANGCWFAARETDGEAHAIYRVDSPLVPVVDTTGAGDTLLAEFCYRYFARHAGLTAETMAHAVAAGALATTRPGALPPDPEAVDRLAREITPVRMDAHAG